MSNQPDTPWGGGGEGGVDIRPGVQYGTWSRQVDLAQLFFVARLGYQQQETPFFSWPFALPVSMGM